MQQLIKRPEPQISRQAVELSLHRLRQQPTDIRLRMAMRIIDEYAATLHTSRVYAHAERVVSQALIDAARANEDGKKIFICEGSCNEVRKKFLIATFSEKELDESIMTQGVGTMPGTMVNTMVGTMHDTGHVTCDIAPITCDIALIDTPDLDVPPSVPDVKLCTQCGQWLPLASYTLNRSRADGHASACRTCEGKRKAQRPSRAKPRQDAPAM